MIEASFAARADYADAILIARRAKNWLFFVLIVVLIGQIGLFFAVRQTDFLASAMVTGSATPAAQPSAGARVLQYLVSLSGFAGLIASGLLCVVTALLVKIMLTARTLGAAKLTSAFVRATLLALLLFPWQAILAGPTISTPPDAVRTDFKLPGVLYTWSELIHPQLGAKFSSAEIPTEYKVLRWARFVGFPAVAVLILLSVQVKSSKGIKDALGEDEPVNTAGGKV